MQLGTIIHSGPEVAGLASAEIVACDAETLHAMMKSFEAGGFELTEPMRNDTAPRFERVGNPIIEMHVEAVHQQVSAPKLPGVRNQLVEIEADSRIVRGDNGTRADADNHIDRNAVTHELSEHADVSRAAQASCAEHNTDANAFSRALRGHPTILRLFGRPVLMSCLVSDRLHVL